MNKLTDDRRAAILGALANGCSVRATTRMTGATKGTVLRLLAEVSAFCESYHDHVVRELATTRIEADEQHSFVGAKQSNAKLPGHGDLWTWVCLDSDSKMVVSWLVGERSGENATALLKDAAERIVTDQVMISTDAFRAYPDAVRQSFTWKRANYAQVIKVYSSKQSARYSPAVVTSVRKEVVIGNPDLNLASTSYIESLNLSTRQHCKRFARLTIAHSRKAANHAAAVSLHFFAHNFVRVHTTLSKRAGRQVTPAMANGLASHPLTWLEVAELMNPKAVTIK